MDAGWRLGVKGVEGSGHERKKEGEKEVSNRRKKRCMHYILKLLFSFHLLVGWMVIHELCCFAVC